MKIISIPWAAWYGDVQFKLIFPQDWQIDIATMRNYPELDLERINQAFFSPIESENIRELAKGRRSAAIVVDDLTRPTPAHRILPLLIDEITRGGISIHNIYIIIGVGLHRPLTREDMIKKVGQDIVEKLSIYNHHPYEDLAKVRTIQGRFSYVNRLFLEAELKVGVGAIVPHLLTGFGGGAKIIIPGIAGIQTVVETHDPDIFLKKNWRMDIGMVKGNECRKCIEEMVSKIGLDFVLNVVVNSQRQITGVFAGDPIKAHREGVKFASKAYFTHLNSECYDIGIFNAYPMDTEFYQGNKALNVLFSAKRKCIVRKGGAVILATNASEGRGFHSLYGPRMRLHRDWTDQPLFKERLEGRRLFIFSPNVSKKDVMEYVSSQVPFFKTWEGLVRALSEIYKKPKVVVFPSGSLQIVESLMN